MNSNTRSKKADINQQILQMRLNGMAYQKIADALGVSVTIVFYAIKKMKDQHPELSNKNQTRGVKPPKQELLIAAKSLLEKNYTIKEVADTLGLSCGTICNWNKKFIKIDLHNKRNERKPILYPSGSDLRILIAKTYNENTSASLREIAAKTGVSHQAVHANLKALGVDLKNHHKPI